MLARGVVEGERSSSRRTRRWRHVNKSEKTKQKQQQEKIKSFQFSTKEEVSYKTSRIRFGSLGVEGVHFHSLAEDSHGEHQP